MSCRDAVRRHAARAVAESAVHRPGAGRDRPGDRRAGRRTSMGSRRNTARDTVEPLTPRARALRGAPPAPHGQADPGYRRQSRSRDTTEAEQMKNALREFGVTVKWVEDAVGQYVRERALQPAVLAARPASRSVYLVTHAWHMPRARSRSSSRASTWCRRRRVSSRRSRSRCSTFSRAHRRWQTAIFLPRSPRVCLVSPEIRWPSER